MEHAQRAFNKNMQCRGFQYEGLNPYFNGTCSKSEYSGYRKGMRTPECLNPYFNGTCSKSHYVKRNYYQDCQVLILILMEHAQRGHFKSPDESLKIKS